MTILSSVLINRDLEALILGTIIMDLVAVSETGLHKEDFAVGPHQELFTLIQGQANQDKPFDPVALKTAGADVKLITSVVGRAATRFTLQKYITDLKRLAFRRSLKLAGQQIAESLAVSDFDNENDALLDRSLSLLANLEGNKTTKDEIDGMELVEIFEDNQRARERGENQGLSTGFSDLDKITRGLKGGQLITIAGRPKMGKTILACNLALAALDQGKAVIFASFELRADELADRFISMLSGVALEKLETGHTDDATLAAKEKLYHKRLLVVTGRSFGVMEFKARIKQLKQRLIREGEELGLIVVDLLTHLRAPAKERRDLEVAFVSRELKVLAQEIDTPVVAVSQLNRNLEYRSNPRPKISDLRESGSIEQDSDKILLLYRPEYYLSQKPEQDLTSDERDILKKTAGKCEINVAAQRQGKNGMILVQFDGECTRFRPLANSAQTQRAFNSRMVES